MRDLTYVVICAVGALLCLVPLPWHWEARSISTLFYLGWVFSACLVCFINSLLWAGNIDDKAPVWCDITSKFYVCFNVSITSVGLCIQRRLYRIATRKEISMSEYSKKWELAIDLFLGLGLPALMLPLYYVVQPSRYYILEDVGCWPGAYPTTLTILLVHIWPVIITSASCVYAAFTILAFIKARRQFSRVLSESGVGLSLSRFFRLMALATMDMACGLPLSVYMLLSNSVGRGLEQWPGWEIVHERINEVETSTYEDLRSNQQFWLSLSFTRWSIPGCAFIFFMFFGLTREVIKKYKETFWRLAAGLGVEPPTTKPKVPTVGWTDRLISNTTATTQGDTVTTILSSVHSTISQTEPVEGHDSKKQVHVEVDLGSVPNLYDIEHSAGLAIERLSRCNE